MEPSKQHSGPSYDFQRGPSPDGERAAPSPTVDTGLIDKEVSERISLAVLLATVAVVVRHSYNAHIYQPDILDLGPHDVSSFVQLLNRHSTASAVPTFFLLSGYLFFRNFRPGCLLRKWNSRFHSLVVPYLLWNALYLAFFLLVAPHVVFIERFSVAGPLAFDLGTVVRKLTLDPAAGHFWYVRDLIGFVMLAPLFFLLYRRPWWAGITLTSLLVCWRTVDRSVLSSEGPLFFFAGGWAGYRQLEVRRLRIESSWILATICVLWLGLCTYQTLWPQKAAWNELSAKISTLTGVAVLWLSVDRIAALPVRDELLRLGQYSFFIYALHTPTVKYLSKVLLSLAPESQYYSLLVYIATPMITIAISVLVAKGMRRHGGRIYAVLTGGRVLPHDRRSRHAAEIGTPVP